MVEIKDLAGLSAPMSKLIDAVSAAIGTVYRPHRIRKEAEAVAYATETTARASHNVYYGKLYRRTGAQYLRAVHLARLSSLLQ